MQPDTLYIQRCLELAALGGAAVAPNPMVGCVIVHQDRIIGEGYHRQFGGPHAEVRAFQSIRKADQPLIVKSTVYVSLGPCCVHGITPACTDLLLKHRPAKVVISTLDPHPNVAGRGVAILRGSGTEVKTGVLEMAGKTLNKRFFTFHQKNRPYVTLKWAQTRDGFFAPLNRQQRWITNELCRQVTHRWRSEEMAILVGATTARNDDPLLDDRYWQGRQPVRLVINEKGDLPETLHLFDGSRPTVVFTGSKQQSGSNITFVPLDFARPVLPQVLQYLHKREFHSLLVEGGTRLLDSFIEAGVWDEIRLLEGDAYWGEGLRAPAFKGRLISREALDSNTLSVFGKEV